MLLISGTNGVYCSKKETVLNPNPSSDKYYHDSLEGCFKEVEKTIAKSIADGDDKCGTGGNFFYTSKIGNEYKCTCCKTYSTFNDIMKKGS